MRIADWQARIIQLLAVPGLLISFYLWLFHNGDLVGVCAPSGWDDCGLVSGPDAPFSSVGPVPVAAIGFTGYAVIFGLIWLRDWIAVVEDYLPEMLVGVTTLALLFTLYLTGLELWVIHAFCRYCIISAIIVAIMFVLSVSYLREVNADAENVTGKATTNTA